MVRDEFHKCTSIKQYLTVVAKKEGYRSPRELLCNYTKNFGYSINDFKLHMQYKYGVYYSHSSYKQAYYRFIRGVVRKKGVRTEESFKYKKVADRYKRITRLCLGYRSFREAIYFLTVKEGLNYKQIGKLYGVSKGALFYRIKQERRIKFIRSK